MDLQTAVGLLVLALLVGIYGTIIGTGGGFVLIPALVLLFDLEGAEAVGTGIAVLVAIGIAGTVAYDRAGLVERPVALGFSVGAVPVAVVSSWLLAPRIDPDTFDGVLGILLLALAVLVVAVPNRYNDTATTTSPPRRVPLAAAGTGVGLLAGTFAVGSGLITVPVIARLQKLSPHRAAATTQATTTLFTLAAVVGHTIADNVVWDYAVVLALGSVVGSTMGARIGPKLAPRTVLILLASGLILAGVPLLVSAL